MIRLLAFGLLCVGCSGESNSAVSRDDGMRSKTTAGDAGDAAVNSAQQEGGAALGDASTRFDPASFPGADASTSGSGPVLVKSEQYAANCAGFHQKMLDCGVLGEGDYSCVEPVTEEEHCAYECLTVASCNILWRSACDGSQAPLQRCFSQCFSFVCDDERSISSDYRCDGVADCLGGADEEGCPTFTCDSGDVVSASHRCNFFAECTDGSDEEGCDVFTCDTGERYPTSFECDLSEDCLDGSDERDCDYFRCTATGEPVPPNWQCDQVDDCIDGSDEVGCAPYLCQ